jgi:cell division protease FtsH
MEKKTFQPNKKRHINIFYIGIALWGVLLLHNVWTGATQVAQIPYSQFQTYLVEGRVDNVRIDSKTIRGELVEPREGEPSRFVTVRVEPELASELTNQNVEFSGEIESNVFATVLSWLLPVLFFVGLWFLLVRPLMQRQGLGGGLMSIGKSTAKVYVEKDMGVTFEDVAGVEEAKAELVDIVEFLETPAKFARLGGRIPKGILLVGAPGTGKTMLAKAVAGEAGVPFFSISGSEFVEMFVGVGAARIRDLFVQAKEKAPCIIFIDELDALGKARGIGPVGNDEREQTLNQLLVEMDGFDSSSGVVLMAATNRPEVLDPALLRAGRFDRHVAVDRPDKEARLQILRVHAKKIVLENDEDLEQIAAMTPGFVGADLANILNTAALLAVRQGRDKVGLAEMQEAVERTVAGLQKKNRVLNPREKERVAFHEVGHALLGLMLPGSEAVQKISIIPRGVAALGYTLRTPIEDRYLMTASELEDKIAVLLGGRAAEELIFGEVSTGASDDLSKATDIAKSMVTQFGMSEMLGKASLEKQQQPFLQADYGAKADYSEETAREIDTEVRRILDRQYERALSILRDYSEVLMEASGVLLEKETITGEELGSIAKALDAEVRDRIRELQLA